MPYLSKKSYLIKYGVNNKLSPNNDVTRAVNKETALNEYIKNNCADFKNVKAKYINEGAIINRRLLKKNPITESSAIIFK